MPPTLPAAAPVTFLAWLEYAGDRALVAWVRDRLERPVEHVVYLRRLKLETLYVGITRVDQFETRIKRHERNATRSALPDAPNEFFNWLHGQGKVIDVRVVPDRCAALLLEAAATCSLAAAGYEVFGHFAATPCPAAAWLPWWGRNWRNPSIRTDDVQLLYSLREFRRVFSAPSPAAA
jgi:hypothetical protein